MRRDIVDTVVADDGLCNVLSQTLAMLERLPEEVSTAAQNNQDLRFDAATAHNCRNGDLRLSSRTGQVHQVHKLACVTSGEPMKNSSNDKSPGK